MQTPVALSVCPRVYNCVKKHNIYHNDIAPLIERQDICSHTSLHKSIIKRNTISSSSDGLCCCWDWDPLFDIDIDIVYDSHTDISHDV